MSEQSWTLSDGHLGYEIMVNGQVIGRAFKTTQAKTEPEDRVTLDGEANGRLMAAAPELLDACIHALEDIQTLKRFISQEFLNGYDGCSGITIELRNAIKKAGGE